MINKQPSWIKKGKEHVWHPYTQEKTAPLPINVIKTEGCIIELANGTRLIDGISSWWSACHGYNHPYLTAKINEQLQKMPHFMFAGVAHEPAYTLAQRLCNLTRLDRVFFTDSGSTSVETAMKMAVQFWHNQGYKNKNKFLSFKNSYHGDTMGCMSLCDPDTGMHKAFNHFMPKQYSVPIPNDEYAFAELDTLMGEINNTVAAVIIEPLVQGAGGMKFHSADILAEIYRITKKHNILFITDEIMTGFARTGLMFAVNEAAFTPDIMCIGKALSGGMMTIAATLASKKIFSAFYDNDLHKALMSGPTFMANPLACATANASLDLFEQEPRIRQVEQIEEQLYFELKPCKKLNNIKDVRVKGAIGVVEVKDISWNKIFALRQEFINQGVWLRPFGNIIYTMPPFTISSKQLGKITNCIYKLLSS